MQAYLERLDRGEDLSRREICEVLDEVMHGRVPAEELGRMLLALREKGESVEEVIGAAEALRRHMTPLRSSRSLLIDTCGPRGDGSGTFNISPAEANVVPAAAIVASAAGVPVAKHGNRAMSSRSGAADVLAELGVNIEAPVAVVERCLEELGIGFCFAPLFHGAMKHVAPVRKQLGVPTIFNMLGPLCNPAGAQLQLVGVGRPELRPKLASALRELGARRALVVHGDDRLDEISLSAPTHVSLVEAHGITEEEWRPEDFGIASAPRDSLLADGPAASASIIREVLDGKAGPRRDIVLLNAAAALWLAGQAPDRPAAARRAAEAIDSGAAARLLARLGEDSRAC